jgi:hypothetical protein
VVEATQLERELTMFDTIQTLTTQLAGLSTITLVAATVVGVPTLSALLSLAGLWLSSDRKVKGII